MKPNARTFLSPLVLLLLTALSTGCSQLMPPTLHVKQVAAVSKPNPHFEPSLWNTVEPVTVLVERGQGETYQARPLQLRAVHDGRALCILASWPDNTESLARQAWAWNEAAEKYFLVRQEVDQLTLLWPLQETTSFELLTPRSQRFDAWQWTSGWTKLSGYADDLTFQTSSHTPGEPRADEQSVLLPSAQADNGLIQWRWIMDEGEPGTVPTTPPNWKTRDQLPGGKATSPLGSAADVQAADMYGRFDQGHRSSWFIQDGHRMQGNWLSDPTYDEKGYWLVKLYRLFVTGDSENDYSFRSPSGHRFMLLLADRESGSFYYQSPPIRLKFEGDRAPGFQSNNDSIE